MSETSTATRARPFTVECTSSGEHRVRIRTDSSDIVGARAVAPDDLDQAFALVYRVYVDERGLLDVGTLPPEQRALRRRWDDHDRAPHTRHAIAKHGDRVVATVRVLSGSDGPLPIERNGFSLDRARTAGDVFETSKLVLDPSYRGHGLVDAMFWLAWYILRFDRGASDCYLSCEPSLQALYRRKLCATHIGQFTNREFSKEYLAMRLPIPFTFDELSAPFPVDDEDALAHTPPSRALDRIVRRATGLDDATAIVESVAPLFGGGATTASIRRIRGTTQDRRRDVALTPWSIIEKRIVRAEDSESPETAGYWKREALAYGSGELADLPGGLSAPAFHSAIEGPDAIRLFIDDVAEVNGNAWTTQDFADAARCLGRFGGAYVAGRPLPRGVWVGRDWLRKYIDGAEANFLRLSSVDNHPFVARAFPDGIAGEVLALWRSRERLLTCLDDCPQTFTHGDANRRNLWRSPIDSTGQRFLAIDWAWCGTGALGHDLAALVLGSAMSFDVSVNEIADTEAAALRGYIEGLHEAGWSGDERQVQFAYAASAALRYSTYGVARLRVLLDSALHPWAETVLGHSITEIADRFAVVCRTALRLAQRARELQGIVTLPPAIVTRTVEHSTYLMEHDSEGDRLEAKTDVDVATRHLAMAGLLPGMSAVDVGCGSGAVTRIIARLVSHDVTVAEKPDVVGIELSAQRVRQAAQLAAALAPDCPRLRFVRGNAAALPIESRSCDFVWSRFLFEYLADPRPVLAEMARVAKPNGIVAVADLDGQIDQFFPLPAGLDTDLRDGLAELRATGFDARVGRKLYTWFRGTRLDDLRVQVMPYQVYAGGVPEPERGNWDAKIATAANVLSRRTGDTARWSRFRDALCDYIRGSDVFYYSNLILVTGRVPR